MVLVGLIVHSAAVPLEEGRGEDLDRLQRGSPTGGGSR